MDCFKSGNLLRNKPSWFWNKNILNPHLNYSLPLVGRGSINYWSRNADNFFIGKFLGVELFGIYSRSYSINNFNLKVKFKKGKRVFW